MTSFSKHDKSASLPSKEDLHTVVITDCGSTTTKALLFQKTNGGWRSVARGEAPTTVEEPVADVTVGVRNALTELEEVQNRSLLTEDDESPFVSLSEDTTQGLSCYLSTSSAGGGLQMLVGGIVDDISTESAQRAALGAGAIVLDALSADDGKEDHERIERIRHVKPDIVLLAGGTDGGDAAHVVEMAEILRAAAPRPRFGDTLTLPVIFAANNEAASDVQEVLEGFADTSVVENVRPALERENLAPARDAIHELFLTHVMSHSPGYDRLLSWSALPVMPTPAAVGAMVHNYALAQQQQVLCVDIGGATTDVFSVWFPEGQEPVFNRTVSANLGMSYSVANVMLEAGVESIRQWLPYTVSINDLRDQLRNKMIRPTSIPFTREDLWLEQAVCREALRLSLEHHSSLAVGLSGVQQQRSIADIFSQTSNRDGLVDKMGLDVVIGSGGVLSHAPHRLQAALMMLDGFELEGVTRLTVDSVFMLPHLGVFSELHAEAAHEIFEKDCIVHLCHSIVPVYHRSRQKDNDLLRVRRDGKEVTILRRDEVRLLELPEGKCTLQCEPLGSTVNVGAGEGKTFEISLEISGHGLLLDGRNRPLEPLDHGIQQARRQHQYFEALGI